MVDQDFILTLEKIAKAWEMPVVQELVDNVKKQKLINTRQLLRSLDAATTTNLSAALVSIGLAFENYGRYQDMKRKRWTALPPLEEIIEWVKQKGVNNFKDKNPRRNKTTERRLNEIAWGIRKKIRYKKSVKANPWFQSTFYRRLAALQEELLLGAADRTINSIKESLTSRLQNA